MRTRHPRATASRAVTEPMNPAPPVISTVRTGGIIHRPGQGADDRLDVFLRELGVHRQRQLPAEQASGDGSSEDRA